jgi:type IV secretion system protein TrbF
LCGLVAGIGLIIAVVGLIIQAGKTKIIPYLVRVNSNGSAQAVGPVPEKYNPQLPEIKYFLAQFVQETRGLPLDPVVAKQNWVQAYALLSSAAAAKMNGKIKNHDPLAALGRETRQVEISVIVPVSDQTYQARWQETVFDQNGAQTEQYRMSGMFTLDFQTPTDSQTIYTNPVGIFIQDFNWEKEN